MIDVIATRRTTLNGTTYKKDAALRMPLQQFQDLKPTGRFERAPARKKAASPAQTKGKVPVTNSAAPSEPAVAVPSTEPSASVD